MVVYRPSWHLSKELVFKLGRQDRRALTDKHLQATLAAEKRQPRVAPALDDQPAHSVEENAQALQPALRRVRGRPERRRVVQVLAAQLLHNTILVYREHEVRDLRQPQLPEQLRVPARRAVTRARGELDELVLRRERPRTTEWERAEVAVLRRGCVCGRGVGCPQARVDLGSNDKAQSAKVLSTDTEPAPENKLRYSRMR
jgi:hypothetical protein